MTHNGVQQHIEYTSRGQPYVPRTTSRLALFHFTNISTRSSLNTIEEECGAGTRLYFEYLKFVFLLNLLIAIIGCINWGLFLSNDLPPEPFTWSDLFVTNYTQRSAISWFWTNFAIFCCSWIAGPVYLIWENLYFKRITPKVSAPSREDVIPQNRGKSSHYLVSAFTVTGCVAFSGTIFYALLEAERYVTLTYGSDNIVLFNITAGMLMGIPVSLSFVLCNTIWDFVSFQLTQMENNKTWFRFRVSHGVKLILYKIATGTIMYVLIAKVLPEPPSSCLLESAGNNFLITVVIDILLITIFVQVFLPMIVRAFKVRVLKKATEKPDFDIAEQLLLVLYRQFIINIAVIVVPPIGILGVIATIVQYIMDKYKMIRVCQAPPHYIEEKPGIFLFMVGWLVSAATFLTYPNGTLWMLFIPQYLPNGYQNCSITGAIWNLSG